MAHFLNFLSKLISTLAFGIFCFLSVFGHFQIIAKAQITQISPNCSKIYFLDNNFAATPTPNVNSKIIEYDSTTNTVISNTREIQSTRTFALALDPTGNKLLLRPK